MTNIKVENSEEEALGRVVHISDPSGASLKSPTIKDESSSRQPANKQPGNFQSANAHSPSDPQANARRENRPSERQPPPRLQSPVHFSSKTQPSNLICRNFNPEEQTYLALWQRRGLQKEAIILSFETTFKRRVEQQDVKRVLTRLEKLEDVAEQLLIEAPSYAWWTPETETQKRAAERFQLRAAARRRLKEGKVRATRPFTEDASVNPISTSAGKLPSEVTAPATAASSRVSTAPTPVLRPANATVPRRAPPLAPLLVNDGLPSPSHHRRPRQTPRTPPLSPLPKPTAAPATLPVTPGSTPGAAITINSDDDEDGGLNPDDEFCLTGRTATPFFATPRLPPPNYRFMAPLELLQIPARSQQSHYGASPITPNYSVDLSRRVSMSPLTLGSPFDFPSQRSSMGRVVSSDAQSRCYPPPDIRSPSSLRQSSQPVRPMGSPQGRGNMYFYPPMEDMDQVAARARSARSVDIRRGAPRAHPQNFQSNPYLYPAPASSPPRRPPQPVRPTGLPHPRIPNAGTQTLFPLTHAQNRSGNTGQRIREDRSFSPSRMEEERMEEEENARHMERLRAGRMDTSRTGRRMM